MDHICVCENGNVKAWYKPRGHFSGTLVRLWQIQLRNIWIAFAWKLMFCDTGCLHKDYTHGRDQVAVEWPPSNSVSSFLNLHSIHIILSHLFVGWRWSYVAFSLHRVMAVPATVIYFTSYDQLCAALRLRMGKRADLAPLLAGSTARGTFGPHVLALEWVKWTLLSNAYAVEWVRVM